MTSFENVHVFSYTTAEISQEYIDKFHESEIVPNYLHDLSQKAGVELFTHDGVYQVKGSWLSVNRAHSFLGKFLLTYGQNRVETKPTHDVTKEEEEGLDFLNRKTFPSFQKKTFFEKTSESVDRNDGSAHHIDQRLPPDKIAHPKNQAPLAPEPVVLYAGYQVSKEAENRRKTLQVLKNVYKMDQISQAGMNKEVPQDQQTEGFHEETTADHSNVEQSQNSSVEEIHASTEDHDSGNAIVKEAEPISNFTKLKEDDGNRSDSNSSTLKRIGTGKCLSKEETAAKRKKVESIAESILSNVPSKETVNVVSHNDDEVCDKKSNDITMLEDQEEPRAETDKSKQEEVRIKSEDSVSEEDFNEDEESDFKDEVDKDYSGDTEIESADDEDPKKSTSDNEYVPEEDVPVVKIKTEKRTTRRSKAKEDLSSLPTPKRGRGRPRKGFPMKLEVKVPVPKSSTKSESPKSKKKGGGTGKKRGRPKRAHSPKEYHCGQCTYVANKKSHLTEHERRVHLSTKQFQCEHCEKIFGFGKDLKRHLKTHLKPENCCDVCGKLYKGVKSLVEHRRTHEEGYVKPEFECEICKKNFSTKYVLAYHIKSEHLGMKRTFMCPTCGKSFSQKNSYLQHANVHMGFKPHKCEICGKAFSYEKSLKEHRFMHDEIRRFKCPVCDKTFRQSSAVTIHMKVHKETKDYVCMACGKGFSQKQALIRHERIHLGEKPFSCGLCGRNFTDSSILRRHMILIHKKHPKKWREDTINNTVRRTDFFIDVLPGVGEEEQNKLPSVKEPNIHMVENALNTPHPDLLTQSSSTSTAEPINMTTQGVSKEGEYSSTQTIQTLNPDLSEHQYHLPISMQGEQIPVNQESTIDPKMAALSQSVLHHPPLSQHQGQGHPGQGHMEGKGEGGEYLPPAVSGVPAHGMQYAMMGQGGYSYPQMVMMPDPNVQFSTPPSTSAFPSQYPDQSNQAQYSNYQPPQS